MSSFEFVTVAVSIILGLGLAELLSAWLELFRLRRVTVSHWVPLTWAALIFLIQLEFWWSLYQLQRPDVVWSHGSFLLVLATTVILSAAGSLILPKHRPDATLDLLEHFKSEGRAGVGALALFNVLAVPLNALVFHVPLISGSTVFIAAMLIAQLGVLVSTNDRVIRAATVVFAVLQVGVLIVYMAPELGG